MMKSIMAALGLAVASSGAVWAQDVVPTRSSESYDQWTVECNTITREEGEPTRICEVVQIFTNQRSGSEVARLAFAYDQERELQLFLRTVVDISFGSKPTVVVDEDVKIEGDWIRCQAQHCFARFSGSAAEIEAFKNTNSANLLFPISSGQTLQIGIGGKGVTAALAALAQK